MCETVGFSAHPPLTLLSFSLQCSDFEFPPLSTIKPYLSLLYLCLFGVYSISEVLDISLLLLGILLGRSQLKLHFT